MNDITPASATIRTYNLGNQHILHLTAGAHELKVLHTPRGWWVYWAESDTWVQLIPAWVRAGYMRDVPLGPGTYNDVATYLTSWADKYLTGECPAPLPEEEHA